jgi:hypothetical protein
MGIRDRTDCYSEMVGSAEEGLRREKASILNCVMNGRMGRLLAKTGI